MKIIFTFLIFFSLNTYAKNICWFGDSQGASSGAIFSQLKNSILQEGHRFSFGRSVCGARINHYISGNQTSPCNYKGQTYLNINSGNASFPAGRGKTVNVAQSTSSCDTAVIQLGDNHLGESANVTRRHVRALATSILNAGKECVWIGPAAVGPTNRCFDNNSKKRQTSEAIKTELESLRIGGRTCKFINSYDATASAPPKGDGMCLHYPGRYNQWASAIRSELLNAL